MNAYLATLKFVQRKFLWSHLRKENNIFGKLASVTKIITFLVTTAVYNILIPCRCCFHITKQLNRKMPNIQVASKTNFWFFKQTMPEKFPLYRHPIKVSIFIYALICTCKNVWACYKFVFCKFWLQSNLAPYSSMH